MVLPSWFVSVCDCVGLPVCPELTRDTIPRSRDVGHFLSVTGTVIRTSAIKVTGWKNFSSSSVCLDFIICDAVEGKKEQENISSIETFIHLSCFCASLYLCVFTTFLFCCHKC